jgi:hypothetical protein
LKVLPLMIQEVTPFAFEGVTSDGSRGDTFCL